MFLLKKLITIIIMPSTSSVILMAAGLVLLWFTQRQRLGRWLATAGLVWLVLPSFPPLADAMIDSLERRNPSLYPRAQLDQTLSAAGAARPRWIVVLAGGHVPDPAVPATDQIGSSALARLAEGIRLQREIPGSKLLLSGGLGGRIKHADVLGAVAGIFGVPAENMQLHKVGRDTEEEAASMAATIGKDPFLLVTSASHLPRAAALFRRQGLHPIPAPAHHMGLDVGGLTLGEIFPSPGALAIFQAGLHEYLGMLWSKLRGRA